MTKPLCVFFLLAMSIPAWGGFANYNSVLIGEEAAGMGGAYTALVGDPAAGPFYNPASLARMSGNTLTATANAYHKYDIQYGELSDFAGAPLRINRGSIVPIPAASGTAYTFGNFAFGLSILFPDFDSYTGQVRNTSETTSYLNLRDESLWVGGSLALNTSEKDSFGLTMYYTSRTFNRSLTDQSTVAAVTTVTTEEKTFAQNSLIYILGYRRQLTEHWSLGLSFRFPSLPINGRGNYFSSQISTGGSAASPTVFSDLKASTKIPPRLNLGVGYTPSAKWQLSADIHYYGAETYTDFAVSSTMDKVEHRRMINMSLGGEYHLRHWLALRAGLYTNFSSVREIELGPASRSPDHVNMWGFSTNLAIHTSPSSAVTLGGYYSGGKGQSAQQVGQQLVRIDKSVQIFSFLVGTSFYF